MPDPPPLGKGAPPLASARSRRLRSTQIHEIVRLTSALQVTGVRAVEAHGVVVHFDAATTQKPDANQVSEQQHVSQQAAGQLSKRAEKRRERSRRRAAERARAPSSAVPPQSGEVGQQQQQAEASAAVAAEINAMLADILGRGRKKRMITKADHIRVGWQKMICFMFSARVNAILP